jgi:hypothetical protein
MEEKIMGFTDWFAIGRTKNKEVEIRKIKEKSVDMEGMAAGNLSAAAEAVTRMMDQKNAPTKVLMVQDGEYMPQVTDYAMKLAQRLDCDIIALDVTAAPLQFSGDRQEFEIQRFMERATKSAEKFITQAEAQGVKVEHIMDVDNPEVVTARVSDANLGVRYVLSKPEEVRAGVERENAHVPVIDLRCSRL